MKTIVIRSGGGRVETLYTEEVDLKRIIGPTLAVERASNVEYDNDEQGWRVLWPNNTIMLDEVYPSREAALAAEVEYLQARTARGWSA